MLENLNAIIPSEQPEPHVDSNCTQVLETAEYAIIPIDELACTHVASVPATKNANAMAQKNIEPRCCTAARLPQTTQLHTVKFCLSSVVCAVASCIHLAHA